MPYTMTAPERWHTTIFYPMSQGYNKLGSNRQFGVELETSKCPNHRVLYGNTCLGAKYDGSVSGMEFITPVLRDDDGLQVIVDFCKLAKKHGFEVDNHCGFHLHMDMNATCAQQRLAITYAYKLIYDIWGKLVGNRRKNGSYCREPRYTLTDIKHADDVGYLIDEVDPSRYTGLNLRAYYDHGTFEIRFHEGTLHAKTICNWIMAHLRFVDYVKNLSFDCLDTLFAGDARNQFETLCRIWDFAGGQRISEFYRRRWLGQLSPVFECEVS